MVVRPSFYAFDQRLSVDVDAQALITAAGYTNQGLKDSVNAFFVSWKSAGYFTNTKYIYLNAADAATSPLCLAQMRFNGKDPRDLDAAFRLTFTSSGSTGSASGYTNAAQSWADTHCKPSGNFNLNSNAIFVYIETNINSFQYDWGASDFTSDSIQWYFRVASNNIEGSINTNTSPDMRSGTTASKGLYCMTRRSSTDEEIAKNGAAIPLIRSVVSNFLGPNNSQFIGALNGGAGGVNPSTKRFGPVIAYNAGVAAAVYLDMSNIINNFQNNVEKFQGLAPGSRKVY